MINKKAYTQVYEIIKNMPDEMQEKIPQDLIKTIEYNMDKEYKFNVEDFEKIQILENTEKILSVIYTDYLATEDERKVILAKERILENQKELQKRKKYPSNFMENLKPQQDFKK